MTLNPRIAIAFVVGLCMVGGSYVLSQNKEASPKNQLTAIVKEEPIRSFIKVTDEDQDGLPDWQNSLTTPVIELDEEEAETEELTKTAAFAIELATRSNTATPDSLGVVRDLGTAVARSALDKQYTTADIVVSDDNTPFALRAYGNAVAKIVLDNSVPPGTKDELEVLNSALLRNDASLLVELDPTIESYEKMTSAMLKTTVPSSLVREHLSLINVYQALTNDIKAFRNAFTDALPAMSRFRRYPSDAEALYVAVSALYLKLNQEGIKWTEADIASRFIKVE